RTFAPLGPAGPRSPGKPIRLPSTTSACGQGAVRASTRGTSGWSPRATAFPEPPCQGTRHGHPSLEAWSSTPWGRSPAAAIIYLWPWGPWGARQAVPALGERKIGHPAAPRRALCPPERCTAQWGQRGPCPHPSSPARPGRPSRPGRPGEKTPWPSRGCPQAPAPGPPARAPALTFSPGRPASPSSPARPGTPGMPGLPGSPGCPGGPSEPRSPTARPVGPWGPGAPGSPLSPLGPRSPGKPNEPCK
ncbi:NFM protein, partial [Lophotis ruficrista]|nr:NFM protein [Lophotis ruficrista]